MLWFYKNFRIYVYIVIAIYKYMRHWIIVVGFGDHIYWFTFQVVPKSSTKTRNKVLKEIEIFHHCKGHDNILQLIEYFEEEEKFYIVFEKMEGGTLLETIQRRGHLTEQEASLVIRDIARALDFLHKKGIAHRDLKPENILCVKAGQVRLQC